MPNFNFDLLEFISATLIYTAILLLSIHFGYFYRKYNVVFDNKSFNTFTIITIITSVIIIYRKDIVDLLMDPPPYAILSAIGLFILTNSINNYQKQLESNKVYTQEQTGLLQTQISNSEKTLDLKLSDIRKTELRDIDGRVEKLENSVEKLENSVEKLENSVEKLENSVEKLENSVEKLDTRVGNLEVAFDKLDKEVRKIPGLITGNNVTLLQQIEELIERKIK
jgi:DNA repair ATPase RecN